MKLQDIEYELKRFDNYVTLNEELDKVPMDELDTLLFYTARIYLSKLRAKCVEDISFARLAMEIDVNACNDFANLMVSVGGGCDKTFSSLEYEKVFQEVRKYMNEYGNEEQRTFSGLENRFYDSAFVLSGKTSNKEYSEAKRLLSLADSNLPDDEKEAMALNPAQLVFSQFDTLKSKYSSK